MNRPVVLAEWKRSIECLGAAGSCHRDGFYADSVSRAYYAVLHAAKAALSLQGIDAESHAAVKRLFDHLHHRPERVAQARALTGPRSARSPCTAPPPADLPHHPGLTEFPAPDLPLTTTAPTLRIAANRRPLNPERKVRYLQWPDSRT